MMTSSTFPYPKLEIVLIGHKSIQYFEKWIESYLAQKDIDFIKDVCITIWDDTPEVNPEDYIRIISRMHSAPLLLSMDFRKSYSKWPLTYTEKVNSAIYKSQAEYVLVMNPDTYFSNPFTLVRCLDMLEMSPEVSALNFAIETESYEEVNYGGFSVNLLGGFSPKEVFSSVCPITLTGTAFVIRKNTFMFLTGFKESFEMYAEETELSLRMAMKGFPIYTMNDTIMHIGGGSQEVKLKSFCPRRRYLTLRNNALLWGANAKNLFWILYMIRLLLIPLEFMAVRKSFKECYLRAFLDSIRMLKKTRANTKRTGRVISEYEFLNKYWIISLN